MKSKTRVVLITAVIALFAMTMAVSGVAAQSADVTLEPSDIELNEVGDTGQTSVNINASQGIASADVTVSIDSPNAEISDASANDVGFDNEVTQDGSSATFEYTDPGTSENQFDLGTVEFEMTGDVMQDVDIEVEAENVNGLDENNNRVPFQVNAETGTLSLLGDSTLPTANVKLDPSNVNLNQVGDTGQTSVNINASQGVASADVTVSIDSPNAEVSGASAADVGFENEVNQDAGSATFSFTDPSAGEDQFNLGTVEFEMTGDVVADVDIEVEAENVNGLDENNSQVPFQVNTETGTLSLGAEPASFEVSNLQAPETVEAGDDVEGSVLVENTGDLQGTQDVELRLNASGEPLDESSVIETRTVELDSGENTTLEFNVTAAAVGVFDFGVFTEDDNETATITVEEPPEPASFEVSNLQAPGTVEEGEEFDVTAEVENVGELRGTQDVEFRLNETGEPLDDDAVLVTETIQLDGGNDTTVEFENLSVSDAGDFDHGVFTEDDNETATITVVEPAEFEVSNLQPASATVTEGDDPINISADVDNVGGAQGTQDLELTVENSSGVQFSDTVADVQLGAGANTTVEFTDVPAGNLAPGDYNHIVSSDDDTIEGNLTVESGDPLDQFRNEQGDIDTAGLQDAIDAFINNEISTALLQDVINEFLAT